MPTPDNDPKHFARYREAAFDAQDALAVILNTLDPQVPGRDSNEQLISWAMKSCEEWFQKHGRFMDDRLRESIGLPARSEQ